MANKYTLEEDADFIEEDPRSEVIANLTDIEEIEAAKELIEDKYDESGNLKDNSSEELEPEKPTNEEKVTDNSKESTDTTDKTEDKDGKKKEEPGEYTLTEEEIEKQPEDVKKLLSNFKGKGKAELAKAAANAMAMKNPYLKGNEIAINAMAERILASGEDIVKTFIGSQKEVGETEAPKEDVFKAEIKPEKIELPKLPEDDPKVQAILNQETIKNLQKKYPDMPDDMTSLDYKDWRRDLEDDNPDNTFKDDLSKARANVSGELSKVVYIQQNLSNLYDESPAELLPMLTEENLPRLKALNDRPMDVLVQDLTEEIVTIQKNLQKYGITEKELGLDFTITKDDQGKPYNKVINSLVTEGMGADGRAKISPQIIAQRGKTFWLKKGELAKKFKEEYEDKILTAFVAKKTDRDRKETERLKDESLNIAGGRNQTVIRGVKPEEVSELTNVDTLAKIQADLEAKY